LSGKDQMGMEEKTAVLRTDSWESDDVGTLKWGIIGCGDLANKAIAPAMAVDRHSKLVAFFSHNLKRAEELREKFGAEAAYDDLNALLGDERVEAVYLSSPVYRHCREAIAAAEAGKHVLCEKPMALRTEDCRRMIAAARSNDVHLGVAYFRRFWPKTRKMKELIRSGAIGKPLSARIRLGAYYDPGKDDAKYWRVRMGQGGGGALQDVGSHRLDVMCHLLGEPQRVAGMADTLTMNYEAPDTETLLCQFANGAHLVCETYWNVPEAVDEFEVRGSNGALVATPFDGPKLVLDKYGETEEFETPLPEGIKHQALIEDFSEAIDEGRTPGFDGYDGMLATAIITSAYRSWASGKWEKAL